MRKEKETPVLHLTLRLEATLIEMDAKPYLMRYVVLSSRSLIAIEVILGSMLYSS